MIRTLFCLILLVPTLATAASITGDWVPPGGDAVLRITLHDSAEIELLRSFEPRLDSENPNVALRKRPLAGLRIGTGFSLEGDHWRGGTLYDPGKGRSYNATLRLIDADHLEVRGYVGIPAFGRNQIWTRKALYQQQLDDFLGGVCRP